MHGVSQLLIGLDCEVCSFFHTEMSTLKSSHLWSPACRVARLCRPVDEMWRRVFSEQVRERCSCWNINSTDLNVTSSETESCIDAASLPCVCLKAAAEAYERVSLFVRTSGASHRAGRHTVTPSPHNICISSETSSSFTHLEPSVPLSQCRCSPWCTQWLYSNGLNSCVFIKLCEWLRCETINQARQQLCGIAVSQHDLAVSAWALLPVSWVPNLI